MQALIKYGVFNEKEFNFSKFETLSYYLSDKGPEAIATLVSNILTPNIEYIPQLGKAIKDIIPYINGFLKNHKEVNEGNEITASSFIEEFKHIKGNDLEANMITELITDLIIEICLPLNDEGEGEIETIESTEESNLINSNQKKTWTKWVVMHKK